MNTENSRASLTRHRCWAICMACTVVVLGFAASLVMAVRPACAWADDGTNMQNTPMETMADADYYAVLHGDGSLVFQALPSDEEGTVTFNGSCTPYLQGKAPWLAQAARIKSVRFDESFAGIRPESLAFWFSGCKNLATIDLQNLDASASTSMRSMFAGCSSLTTIEHLSSFDTSSSTYFGSMFRDCSSLVSLDLSHFDATHVGVLCFMFAGCTSLETLNMAGEGWRTSSLYLMVHVWENCSSLKSLDLSYLNTSGVHSMAMDFSGCSSLEYLDLSGADTSNVGSLKELFKGCAKLTTVKLGPKFTFNGASSAPQCSLPEGVWKSSTTGVEYANVDVPNNTADTYTRVSKGEGDNPGDGGDPTTNPDDSQTFAPGEYPLPNLKSSLGMFDHFVDGSQKLTVDEDKVTLEFTTDGSIKMVREITKVAIGPSSKLANVADMKEGETKYANSLVGNPVIFEGVLVSSAGEPNQYAFELEFARTEFEQMIGENGGVYLTLFQSGEKNAWHKGDNDLLLTLGELEAPNQGGDADDPVENDGSWLDGIDDIDTFFVDGTYSVELTVLPSMVKLSGHDGMAPEPTVVISGGDAWLITSYRSSLGSAWRYSQLSWGSYEEVLAANKDGVGGAPTFKENRSAACGLSDATIDSMTFALPIAKADFIAWAVSGEAKPFTIRYVKGYSAEHDGDWWKATNQPTMAVTNVRIAAESVDVPADYAAVFDAVASVPEDLSMYTDESVKNLEESLAAVNGSPKPKSQQVDVDAMASAISNAIAALELKADETDDPGADKVTHVTVNAKTVAAETIAAAIAAAGGEIDSVTTITLGKKVEVISKGAFKSTNVTSLVAKTKKLSKKSVKGSLAGSKVTTVKVNVGKAKANEKVAKKYEKLFTKKNAGKKALVVC